MAGQQPDLGRQPHAPGGHVGKAVICCVAGCGPAGAVLGLLLARAGLDVLVLEKHGDFLRDFRGDTLHPSTLELMAQLGLAEKVLQLPHSTVSSTSLETANERVVLAEFGRLRTPFPFIVFTPQWGLLDLITAEARRYPGFQLLMEAEAEDLIEERGTIRGLRYRTADGLHEVRAHLTVAADGRWSRLRHAAGLRPVERAAPIDLFWFPISRHPNEPDDLSVRLGDGHLVVLINRLTYWQVGYLILKGTEQQVRAAGLDAFKASLAALVPELADRVSELRDWDQLKPLTVRSDRLPRWYRPGFLCIGDAAHAMSPVAGVGINLAIQDAVTAANVLHRPLHRRALRTYHLRWIQLQRELPVRLTQALQGVMQRRLHEVVLQGGTVRFPAVVTMLRRFPALRRLPARLIGLGIWRVRVSHGLARRLL